MKSKHIIIMCFLLVLLTMPLIKSAFATEPPTITRAELEKTRLYRGLQTLRATLEAVDDKDPPKKLKAVSTIVFADGQTITAPMIFEPKKEVFYRFLLIPEAAGLGTATITITVTDTDGLSNSTTLTFEVYDHKPVLTLKEEAIRAIAVASTLIASWAELGINMTTPSTLIAEAENELELAEVALKSLEDVEGALVSYGKAKASAELAIEKAKTNAALYKAAEDALRKSQSAIERARAYIDAWLPKGLNMTTALGLLKDAETEHALGLNLMALEGSPGAALAFKKAEAYAEYAMTYAISIVEAFSIAEKAMEEAQLAIKRAETYIDAWLPKGLNMTTALWLLEKAKEEHAYGLELIKLEGSPGAASSFMMAKAYAEYAVDYAAAIITAFTTASEKLIEVKAVIDSVTAYVNSLKALGVDMGRAYTLLEYAEEIYRRCEATMAREGVPGVFDALDTAAEKAMEALTEANAVANEYTSHLISKARDMLAFIKGRPFTPDTKLAEALIDLVDDALEREDYLTATARANQALMELIRLEGPQTAAINITTLSIVLIIVAVVITLLLLRRPAAKA